MASFPDPEGVRLLILEEYYLLEKKKIIMAMHPEAFSDVVDVDTPTLAGCHGPDFFRLLQLEEYFLLKKRGLLESSPIPRRWWVRPIWENRKAESEFYTAMPLLMSGDPDYFRKYYRMTPQRFEELHALVEEQLTKEHVTREPLPSRMRLAITLRYLASGMHMQQVALSFRTGISTVTGVVHFTCRLLWNVLQPLCLKMPTTQKWQEVAEGFHKKWNFPHCVGAVDGKHVQIQAPSNSGSLYFNYKGTYSIVLMAVADSNLKFIMVDVGGYGRQSDGGTLSACRFGKCLERGVLGLPAPKQLPNSATIAPHVFIGDEAFQLRPDFLRPYSGRCQDAEKRIFNYRLSRARRCVESAFGVMASRFRIFRRVINLKPENADFVVLACCVLHNFLTEDEYYMDAHYTDQEDHFGNVTQGQWRSALTADGGSAMLDLQPPAGHNFSRAAAQARDIFCAYFSSAAGAVAWQRASAGLRP